jgi:hypothetical protein
MKRCYLLSFITLCILFAGCKKQTERNTDIHVIDFERSFDTERQMFLSEIADSIEYVELKTPDDIVVTRIWDVKQIDDYLIIRARLDAYLFHKNGQFIRQIGARGQGPGEYHHVGSIEIDRKKKEILIADVLKLLFYDLNGNFLRSKTWKDVNYLGISDSILWVSSYVATTDWVKFKAIAVSLQDLGDTLACILNPHYGIRTSGKGDYLGAPYMKKYYRKNGLLYFKGDASNDTIWRLSGAHAKPYAFIDMGKYKLPLEFEAWYSSDAYRQNSDAYWAVQSVAEDDHYFFLLSHNRGSGKDGAIFKYVAYDSKRKTVFSAKDSKGMGITDDLLGGPPVWPYWISDEYYINSITAEDLLEQIKSGQFSKSLPLTEEQLSRTNEWSNDLIILCHRKK